MSVPAMPLVAVLLLALTALACAAPWRAELERELPALGHRNWIVIADGAYPSQVSPGIRTLATGAEMGEVVRAVLAEVDASRHVRAEVWLDAELARVSEADAPGIERYRAELAGLLAGSDVRELPHAELLARLDAEGRLYRVLILKTDLALPYTSVFVRLECGYWSAEAEQRLRERTGD